ncbi:MFS transporter [Guptibacillus algicola]|uniref:MFS transporter n=1 Tax=Guptibacillus algicola TaxID=225844 RepID=UPI001CD2C59D|nr:MFS transporter [Alkalihalobacillus algicola]MCA0987680.1 MFS transporter [Alkalihalobacillus algicola]
MKQTLLRNRGYITLMIAQLISSIGDWLSIVAIITMVGLKWNATPIEVSLIILCLAVPMALFGPFAGTFADRFNRKTLMVVSDLVRAGLVLMLIFATTIWMVYICLFGIGMFAALFIPAKNGKLKELVPDDQMKSAMSITSMIDSGTKVLGPLLSGLLVTAFGANPVFLIDSATFILSAILLLTLPASVFSNESTVETNGKAISFKEDFLQGVSFMKGNRFLLVGLSILTISLLILQLSDSQIIVLIRELTNASPDLFGILVTGSGLGMFFSGWLLAKKTEYKPILLMLLGVCGMGVSFGLLAVFTGMDLSYSILWGPGLGLVAGFSAGIVFIPFQAAVQTDTPVHITGRVFGVINSATTTATIIGPLLGGILVTIFGVIPMFIATGSLLVMMSLVGLLFRSKIERRENDVSKGQQRTQGAASS